jgi:hypothetical protein
MDCVLFLVLVLFKKVRVLYQVYTFNLYFVLLIPLNQFCTRVLAACFWRAAATAGSKIAFPADGRRRRTVFFKNGATNKQTKSIITFFINLRNNLVVT